MRKKLLITTALVAAFTATNAYAKIIDTLPEDGKDGFQGNVFVEEHTGKKSATNYNADYLTDKEITIKNIYMQTLYGENEENRKGMDVGEQVNTGSANTQKLVISDGARLDINRNQGDEGFLGDPSKATNLFNVNGGTVELNNGELHADGIIKITDGNITLNGSEFIAEDAGAKLVIEGGTINVINGNERFNGIGVEITEDNSQEGLTEASWGPVEMTGGTINVNGKAGKLEFTDSSVGNYLIGSEINISDGTFNINDNSGVTVTKGFKTVDENDIATLEKGSINLTNTGVINLSGSLISNVDGDGNLNINSSSAKVDGDVSGSNLTFEADHTLSQAISGQIDSLASLSVNGGTLNFDKQTGLINEVNVAENAGLQVNILGSGPTQENVQLRANSFTSSGNIELLLGSDITAQNNLEINGGSVVATNGDLESFNTININGGTLNLSDSSDITALKGLNISGGEINISDGEIWSLGDINLKDGTVNLSNFAAITTDFDDLDGIFNGTQKPEIAGNINITGSSVNVKDKALLISEGNINLNGTGVIDVQDGATLFTTKTLPDEVEESDLTAFIKDNKATINLTDTGTANISGTLLANVEGDGNLNIKSSNAVINGDIKGSQLTFETDHSLSKALLGENIELASLNVNKGTLTYDKTDDSIIIGKVEISDGAGINLIDNGEINSQGTFTSSGNIIAGQDAAIHANGIEINNGNITLNGTDFTNDSLSESFKVTGGTITMNGNQSVIGTNHGQGHEETNGKFEMTGGNVNVQGSENYIEGGDVAISGGSVNIAQKATLQTVATLAGSGIPGDIAKIKLTDEGTVNLSGSLISNVEGNGNLNINSSSANIDGDVSGSNLTFETDHSLSQAISGTIGDLASLSVNKGTLAYDAQTGKIGNLNVAGGLDIGTNTVNATTATFADNSNLALRVASTSSFGNITADNITIGKDTTMKVTLDNGVVNSGENETFTFLNSENIEGSFTNKIAENSRYDIKWNEDGSLSISGKDVTSSDIVADAGGTSSNASTAEAWESIDDSSDVSEQAKNVSNVLYTLSQDTSAAGKKAYTDALTTVAPEVAPMVQHTQTQTANQVFGAVGTRLTGGSVSTGGQGMSSGDNIFERAALWVQGLFNHSKLDDTSKAYGFDADSSGVAMGAEKYVTEDTKIGLGYAYTNTDIDGFMRSTDVDTHTAFVYGEYKPSNWYVNGIMSYGWSDYSENKNVSGVGVKADYDAETFGLQAMTGYDMQLKHFGLTPEMGLRYVHISQDGYKDSADQRVSANDSDILTGVIGAKVSKTWTLENGMNIKPEARIAATYDLMNDDVNSVVTLANGSAYMVEGDALDRFGMEFGAGVTAEVNDNVELSLGYEGKFREDYQDHTGLLNAKYKF